MKATGLSSNSTAPGYGGTAGRLGARAALQLQFEAPPIRLEALLDLVGGEEPMTVEDRQRAADDGRGAEPHADDKHGDERGGQQKGSGQPAAAQQYYDTQNDAGERSQPARDAHPRSGPARLRAYTVGDTLGDEKDAPQHSQQAAENAENAAEDPHVECSPAPGIARALSASSVAMKA